MPTINTTLSSPNHSPRTSGISAIVIHHGAGTRKSDLATLTSPASGVSSHYYVCRDGTIYQLVADAEQAWHAGASAIDGIPHVNNYSLGIETEHQTLAHLPQHTDWPPAQLAALAWLIRSLAATYDIPPARVVSHRACALPKGRKDDPRDAPLAPEPAFRAWVAGVFGAVTYTEDSPLIGTTEASALTVAERLVKAKQHYTPREIRDFVTQYYTLCTSVKLNPLLAIAQMVHETGWLTSWWCDRPRRNAAGVGVNGRTRPGTDPRPMPPELWHLDSAAGLWRHGVAFATWQHDSIPAHVGRLLRYALKPGTETPAQAALITRALSYRTLPESYHGIAPTLKGLEGTWAVPGHTYADAIAAIATRLGGA